MSRSQHGRHVVQRIWVRQVNHNEVKTDSRLLNKFIGLNRESLGLADLLHQLRSKLKRNARD